MEAKAECCVADQLDGPSQYVKAFGWRCEAFGWINTQG